MRQCADVTRDLNKIGKASVSVGALLRLFFTSDGVVVGVVIKSVERYDLLKIKPTESEAEHQF